MKEPVPLLIKGHKDPLYDRKKALGFALHKSRIPFSLSPLPPEAFLSRFLPKVYSLFPVSHLRWSPYGLYGFHGSHGSHRSIGSHGSHGSHRFTGSHGPRGLSGLWGLWGLGGLWGLWGLWGPLRFQAFWGFLGFLIYLWELLHVLIIPKWLMNDSGPIAILFRWFLELQKNRLKLDP